MATPTIVFDNATGSDTAASGAGPATALTGTAASTSGTGLVVTLDGLPSLAAVATDGSHAIWIDTAAGRQFAAITAKDDTAKTVTVTTAFTASISGRTWAIGGKRATLDNVNSRKLFSADAASTWAVDVREAGINYTLATTLNIGVSGLSILSTSTNRPTITTSVNSTRLITFTGTLSGAFFSHLRFTTTAATRASCFFPSGGTGTGLVLTDCVVDGFAVAFDGSFGAGFTLPGLKIDGCEVINCNTCVQNVTGNTAQTLTHVLDSFFADNTGNCFLNPGALVVERTIFTRNVRVVNAGNGVVILRHCAVHGSTDVTNPAISVTNNGGQPVELTGNVFYGMTAGAVTLSGVVNLLNRYNAYGANGTNRTGFSAGTGDVSLTANPFTNAALNNFTPNSTAGGGAALAGVIPGVRAPGLIGTAVLDIGPYQAAAVAAAAGVYRRRVRTLGV